MDHPLEYAATIVVGAALLIASYILGAWLLWGVGLWCIAAPVIGVPQIIASYAQTDPRRSGDSQ